MSQAKTLEDEAKEWYEQQLERDPSLFIVMAEFANKKLRDAVNRTCFDCRNGNKHTSPCTAAGILAIINSSGLPASQPKLLVGDTSCYEVPVPYVTIVETWRVEWNGPFYRLLELIDRRLAP